MYVIVLSNEAGIPVLKLAVVSCHLVSNILCRTTGHIFSKDTSGRIIDIKISASNFDDLQVQFHSLLPVSGTNALEYQLL